MGKTRGQGFDPNQLQIDWSRPSVESEVAPKTPSASPLTVSTVEPPMAAAPGLVQRLPWDFQTTFPQPTTEAIDAGIISDEDTTPEAIQAIHDEHAREALAVLHDLDAVLDARRRGVDPRNNKAPTLQPAKERLEKFFVTEPARLEHWFQNLMDVYEQAFGAEAADAFNKALRARHAGIPVVAEDQPETIAPTPPKQAEVVPKPCRSRRPRHIVARLPVPRPLPAAIAACRFGQEENGKPVRPSSQEVRAITEQLAEKLIDLLDSLTSTPANTKDNVIAQFMAGITAYAEDFGPHAADQLEAYTRRQAGLDPGCRRGR
jgi:hypothetical protein